ncbi:MAG: glycosyltransferase family 9 protein, partial [Bacteroidota bacterium]
GKLTFQEELALISNLDLMLSMDSGNAHLAAMYGIPVVTLWGVTHPYAGFYPIKQARDNALLANRDKYPLIPTSVYGNKMPSGYEKAMETISPEAVFQKIEMILRKGNSASIP